MSKLSSTATSTDQPANTHISRHRKRFSPSVKRTVPFVFRTFIVCLLSAIVTTFGFQTTVMAQYEKQSSASSSKDKKNATGKKSETKVNQKNVIRVTAKFDPIPSNLVVTTTLQSQLMQAQATTPGMPITPAPWKATGSLNLSPASGQIISYVAVPLNLDGNCLNATPVFTGTATLIAGSTRDWQINNLSELFISKCPVSITLTFKASDGKFKIGSVVVFPPY